MYVYQLDITGLPSKFILAWYFNGKALCFGRDKKSESVDDEQCAFISEIIQHPNYDRSETVLNDICMLRLTSKLEYNTIVQPACLPNHAESLSNDLVGDEEGKMNQCFVAGWGFRYN